QNNNPQPYYQPTQPQQQPGAAAQPIRLDINDFRNTPQRFGSQYGPPPFYGGNAQRPRGD
ncbi:hypothetical protein PFISCL1PPCAC_8722, partial [Pristionchus fissidentatus]